MSAAGIRARGVVAMTQALLGSAFAIVAIILIFNLIDR